MAAKRIYNQTALFGPLYAYLVVLSPPQEVIDEIATMKRQMNAIADITERNLHSKAHITLTDKLTDDAEFAETVEGLLSGQQAFTIAVNGWDIFDHGHSITVYLRVETPEPIVKLAVGLKSKATTPHISLAKRLSYETYGKILPYLQTLNYHATWQCSEVLVLRKLMSEKHLGFKESFPIELKTNN
ncbi:MAG: 2'-5' RNA ligase family protein [Bacteroidia bacterium]